MKVACVQMRSGVDIDANLAQADRLIRQAAGEGAVFVATPENTHLLQTSSKKKLAQLSPENEDKGVRYFSALAKELGVHLLIGSLGIKIEPERGANRSFLFDPAGNILARYDKIHMFDVQVSETETWRESQTYKAGHKAVLVDIGAANIGLTICYDLRFPHLYRKYAQAGAHIITVPSAFTRPTGMAHWETLLRARAIETGSFIMAPAQGGTHEDGRATWGHSMIIGPWGDIIAEIDGDEPGVICVDIDINDVAEARRRIPAWNHNPEFSL